ncbi:MAG: maf protein [Jatrophihabitantaceae bacterium]|nr:maf protein [Jatrophihabitantaceae bacterium]
MSAKGSTVRLVLASASPARLQTLRAAGAHPDVIVSGVDEPALVAAAGDLDPEGIVAMLARAKALDVADRIEPDPGGTVVIVGCDSMLDLDGRAYGKPGTSAEAIQRWREMRGLTGVLRSGHAVIALSGGERRIEVAVSSTSVRFADASDDEIEAYVATREPLSVAGGFTIDGLGGWFIEGIDGDHHGVVGISLPLLRVMLRNGGVTIADLWAHPNSDKA